MALYSEIVASLQTNDWQNAYGKLIDIVTSAMSKEEQHVAYYHLKMTLEYYNITHTCNELFTFLESYTKERGMCYISKVCKILSKRNIAMVYTMGIVLKNSEIDKVGNETPLCSYHDCKDKCRIYDDIYHWTCSIKHTIRHLENKSTKIPYCTMCMKDMQIVDENFYLYSCTHSVIKSANKI